MSGAKNTGVTVYHKEYDPDARRDVWTAAYYPEASWYAAEGATINAEGESADDKAVIRLFTRDDIPLASGDMAVRGKTHQPVTTSAEIKELYPNSIKVLRIRDNRRGSAGQQHWRIEGA